MPVEVEPPELARLLELSELPRVEGWSLRAALVRYAQPEPFRVGAILELVRRIEFALGPHRKLLEREGADLWAAVERGTVPDAEPERQIVAILLASADLDRLADRLAAWAVDVSGPRPDDEVDRVVRDVASRLDAFDVPREERMRPPPRGRG